MNSLLSDKKIDVVDFDGLKLFMFKNDNLYENFIPHDRKNQSLDTFFKSTTEKKSFPPPPINFLNCEENTDPRAGLFIFFKHLIERRVDFTVLDIGSHIGDFAIKCGHFFRDAGKQIKTISFDPSPAGMLVPYNIEVNGLAAYNNHESQAITQYDGYYVFHFKEGNSDSAKLSFSKKNNFWQKLQFYSGSTWQFKIKIASKLIRNSLKFSQKTFDLVVRGSSLENYLKNHNISNHLFIKIDVEGYDEVLVREIIKLKKKYLISAISELQVDADSVSFLNEISEHFYIFDLFYCPNPTRFKMILPENFEVFVNKELKNREFGYTDLFLLDKQTPDADILIKKLSLLQQKKDAMIL